jgi:hypothetical protein
MSKTPPKDQHEAQDFRRLPEPIRLEDMVTTQEARDAPDPTLGRDADTEWLLRNGAG